MSIREQVRAYIMENHLFTSDDSELADKESLMTRGVIDSTGALELILFLEESYDITVNEDEMTPENLDSIDQIVSYVTRKRADG